MSPSPREDRRAFPSIVRDAVHEGGFGNDFEVVEESEADLWCRCGPVFHLTQARLCSGDAP
jgi:hypothetical protein